MQKYIIQRPAHLRWLVLVIATAMTLLVAACGGGADTTPPSAPAAPAAPSQGAPAAAPAPIQVKMIETGDNVYSFSPSTITVQKGQQIVWTNTSDAPHTVTSDNGAFTASSNVSQNQTFTMTLTTAGTFAYHCSIHPSMKATITVTG